MTKRKKLFECHRCKQKVPFEDLMLLGCKQCGGDNGTKHYGIFEAKFNGSGRRHNGVIH